MAEPPVLDIAAAFRTWLKSLPKLPYLIAGFVLILLGLWTRSMGGLAGLKRICDGIVSDLGLIQPFTLFHAYFGKLTACDHYDTHINCSPWRYINPTRVVGAFIETGFSTLQKTAGPGRFLLPLLLIASFALTVQIIQFVRRRTTTVPGEFNIIHFCLAAVTAPVLASLIALAAQLLGIALFFVFGWVIGLLLWLIATFGGLWSAWKLLREGVGKAKKIEEAANTVSSYLGKDSGGDRAMG